MTVQEAAPGRIGHRGPNALPLVRLLAHHRHRYPLSVCYPAEPNSVSSGNHKMPSQDPADASQLQYRSHAKSHVQNIAVADDVVLRLLAHQVLGLDLPFAADTDQVRAGHHLGPDETAGEVGVDIGRGL